MLLNHLWEYIDKQIIPIASISDGSHPVFNFYRDTSHKICLQNGPEIRSQNLFRYLASFPIRPTILVIGEAPGWRGCRFTGVPFTSEALILKGELPFGGQLSSNSPRPYAEASATIFWRVMRPYHPNYFVWNCIPFHPYNAGRRLSNRKPTLNEIRTYLYLLEGMIDALSPDVFIAVGRSAESTLTELNLNTFSVRHPSHGGAQQFNQQMREIFNSVLD